MYQLAWVTMSSLVNAPTNTEKDDSIKAPKLTSSNSKAIANYLVEFEKFEQEKRAFNEVNSPQFRRAEVRFMYRIDEKLKEQFLTTTLPTNLSSLHPEARRFRTLQQGQLHATDKVLLDRAKVRAEEILNRVRRESLDKMRADLSRMRTLIVNVDVQDNTDSDSILILEQHIEDLANAELIALINQKIPHLTPYIAFSKYVFWDEELIRLLFQKILHNVVQRGQLIIPSLVQELGSFPTGVENVENGKKRPKWAVLFPFFPRENEDPHLSVEK